MFFLIIFVLLVLFNKKLIGSYMNGFLFVFLPYAFIIPFNNYFWKDTFYPVSSDSMLLMISSMIVYEIGFFIYYSNKKNIRQIYCWSSTPDQIKETYINYRFVERFIIAVAIYRFVVVIIVYLSGGFAAIARNSFAALDLGFIGGRLVICLYPAGWLLACRLFSDLSLSKQLKLKYIFLILVILCIQFMSTVKTHAMVFVLGIYLISIACDKKNIIKGFIVLVGLVVGLFFGNYAIQWFSIDKTIPSLEYTIQHFWKYIAGGTINLNGIISSDNTTYNFFDFWTQVLSPIPNEFLIYIGKPIVASGKIPYISGFPNVSPVLYELSNVTNLFGRFYGAGGLNIIGFVINTLLFGIITEKAFYEYKIVRTFQSFMLGMAVLGYSFLSFFSLYYSTSSFWQMLIYIYLFCAFASGKITIGKINQRRLYNE